MEAVFLISPSSSFNSFFDFRMLTAAKGVESAGEPKSCSPRNQHEPQWVGWEAGGFAFLTAQGASKVGAGSTWVLVVGAVWF